MRHLGSKSKYTHVHMMQLSLWAGVSWRNGYLWPLLSEKKCSYHKTVNKSVFSFGLNIYPSWSFPCNASTSFCNLSLAVESLYFYFCFQVLPRFLTTAKWSRFHLSFTTCIEAKYWECKLLFWRHRLSIMWESQESLTGMELWVLLFFPGSLQWQWLQIWSHAGGN